LFSQVPFGAKLVSRQFVCLCSHLQLFPSTTKLPGLPLSHWVVAEDLTQFVHIIIPGLWFHKLCATYINDWCVMLWQSRVLMYGIAGAVVFRAIMIALGAATLQVRILFWVVSRFLHSYSGYNYSESQYSPVWFWAQCPSDWHEKYYWGSINFIHGSALCSWIFLFCNSTCTKLGCIV
jgi:hypothetical protein